MHGIEEERVIQDPAGTGRGERRLAVNQNSLRVPGSDLAINLLKTVGTAHRQRVEISGGAIKEFSLLPFSFSLEQPCQPKVNLGEAWLIREDLAIRPGGTGGVALFAGARPGNDS